MPLGLESVAKTVVLGAVSGQLQGRATRRRVDPRLGSWSTRKGIRRACRCCLEPKQHQGVTFHPALTPAPRKYPDELRVRSQRLVREAREQEPDLSLNAAVKRIGPRVGINPDTL